MHLSPDQLVYWQHGFLKLNGTIVFTWALMLVLVVGAKLITRHLSTGDDRSRWQNLVEIVVTTAWVLRLTTVIPPPLPALAT